MKKTAAVLIFFLSAIIINAQENEFVAFSLKGKVYHKANAKVKDWEVVSAKTPFYITGEVKLEQGAELVLLHKEYKTIKVTKAGTHKISKLSEDIKKQKTDESTAYLQFIWKEFNKKHKSAESYHKDYLDTKGGVDRSTKGCTRPLMLTPGYGEKVYTETITLNWVADTTATMYTVVFYQDEYEDIKLLEFDVAGTSLTLSAKTFWFRPGQQYYWVAYPKGRPNCARFSFSIIKKEDADKMLADIKAEFDKSTQTAIDAVKAGSTLEDAGFMEAAGEYYYKALTLSNQAEEYKILYSGWLARVGRFEEAKKWWVA